MCGLRAARGSIRGAPRIFAQTLRLNVCSSATSECALEHTLDLSQQNIVHLYEYKRRDGLKTPATIRVVPEP